ncbi:MAG: class I SAM-dependent methyltransferase [Candidatus Bathyarchaeota archaeon]|nr:class I SAM-dependent methyltransferase [Candidatus Bathyarchaeota archaeon]
MTQNRNHGCIDNAITTTYLKQVDSKATFISYWHQILETFKTNKNSVLEVGIGNKFVSNYLNRFGFEVITVDILKGFKPLINSSILNLPFEKNSFDVVLCCEVLEHLPFKNLKNALLELNRVVTTKAIISLPDVTPYISINVHCPLGGIQKIMGLPNVFQREQIFDGQHHWEIGKKGYPIQKICQIMNESGFSVCNTYRVIENPYHRFFILSKKANSTISLPKNI